MKNTITEPPGTPQTLKTFSRRSNVITFPKPLVQDYSESRIYRSVDDAVHDMRPEMPVYCLRPSIITQTAKRFLKQFPGDVMYAVKCNPDMRVLGYLSAAGITNFDVASLAEVKLVAELLPNARLYFMHPVKSRASIAAAYFQYGVRDFSLDSHEELRKILEVTDHADDLNLYVRLAIANESAAYSLSGRYGVALDEAGSLLQAVRKASRKLAVCFHVGSQCMDPVAYGNAMQAVADLVTQSGVTLDILDIGGGFPSIYPGMTPPSLSHYMKAIKKGLKQHAQFADCRIICEPGRALVAEGGSTLARVDLRKGNMLFLNEGTYGSLFDAGHPGFVFPVKAIRPDGALSSEMMEFGFYGPTCDSLDTMKGPFTLPADIGEGDWIEIGQLGAYGATMRTNFNGFYSDTTIEVGDKPLLSMLGVN
jgi:ornithine decarboxylase